MTPDHEVAIIGAGLSGIGMGVALKRSGIEDFVLLERASDIGGTWRDNTYPGIAVDIPAQAYQFTYELNPGWSRVFARGHEVKAYIDRLADKYAIRPHVRLSSEVRARTWDADAQLWRLTTPDGELTARFVVSAIGVFVDPKPPEIAGLDDFAGKLLHAARWDHDYDLAGKRVAVIGTGASAVQIVPEIARAVAHLDVYQRTPIWVGPRPDYRTPAALERLFRRVPPVQRVVRGVTSLAMEIGLIWILLHHSRVPFLSNGTAAYLRKVWYPSQVRDPELRAKLTPDYGLGCKRPAVSNGYLRSFTKPHVELVTTPIERITPTGIQTTDGTRRDVDALVLATGFRLSVDPENYRRTPVRGRDGFDLATSYERDRLASYEGVSLPRLPNHFIIFGPYGWTGGTWHEIVETASAHVVRVIGEARRRGAAEVEVRPEACDRWMGQTYERFKGSLWKTPACATANSYYYDHHGDTSYLRPTTSMQARWASRHFPLEDYAFTPPLSASPFERAPASAAA